MSDIGRKMYERRHQLGLTLEEVGDAVGVGKSTVRRWEKGIIKNMGGDKIAALAKVLKMNPIELVPDDDPARDPVQDRDKERLEALHQNPRLGLLFDHSSKMKPEDVDVMIRFAEGILRGRDGDDTKI